MENTIENKAKFFAQYWNQKVGYYDKFSNWNLGNGVLGLVSIELLELTHLSQITDKHCIEVGDIYLDATENARGELFVYEVKELLNDCKYLPYQCVDYLRSKGYALPYMGLSVETMIEYGWIKLKTK